MTIQSKSILLAVATATLLAAAPALAGGPGHGGGGCGGGCGGHQPQPPRHGGGNFNYNVNVNAQASAHAQASAASYSAINARGWSGHGEGQGGYMGGYVGGGTFYGGGGYAEGGYGGGWIPAPVPVQFYGPAPVSAPFGYAVYGFGRAYNRGPYYIPAPPPAYVDHREERRFEDSSYRYEESAAYEERWSGGSAYHEGDWAVPPPCDCRPAPEPYPEPYRPAYPSPTEVPYSPAPQPGYYGDFPEHIPYAQEPGERG